MDFTPLQWVKAAAGACVIVAYVWVVFSVVILGAQA